MMSCVPISINRNMCHECYRYVHIHRHFPYDATVAELGLSVIEGCRVGVRPGSRTCRHGQPVSILSVCSSCLLEWQRTTSDLHYAWVSCGDRSTPQGFL